MSLILVIIATASNGVVAFGASEPDVKGTSAIVFSATTNEVLWEKNADEKENLASITKLMTCLIAVEELGIDYEVTVDEEATKVDKTESAVYAGEVITVEDLVYEALLESANDAAKALAIATSGSQKKFVKLMNARAEEIGCTNTKFVNASGVKTKTAKCTSTARDIVLIAREAFKNSDIKRIAGEATHTLAATNKNPERTLESTNLLLAGGVATTLTGKYKVKAYDGVFAGKTGTTPEYNATMVVACNIDGFSVYAVIMNSTLEKRYSDITKLLDYAKASLSKYVVFEKGADFGEAKLKGGATNKVAAVAGAEGFINLPEGASASLVSTKTTYTDDLKAPIAKGDKVGTVEIYIADDYVRTINLRAAEDVKEGWFLSGLGITNAQTVVIMFVLFILLTGFVAIMTMRTINLRKRKAARQRKLQEIARQQLERERDLRRRDWPY